MKNILGLTLLLLFAICANAQDDATIPGKKAPAKQTTSKTTNNDEFKGYASLRLGISSPTGDFGSNDISVNEAGFALPGFNVSLNAGYKLGKNFGVAFNWMGAANYIDEEELTGNTLDSSPWSVGSIAIGPMMMQQWNKVIFDYHLLFGRAVVFNPDLGGVIVEDSANALALILGANVKYVVTNNFFISGTFDWFQTQPSFENAGFDQTVSMLLFNAGFGIAF